MHWQPSRFAVKPTLPRICILLLFLLVPLMPTLGQEAKRPLTNADIIDMAKSGIGEQTIILTIQKSATRFDTTAEGLIDLKKAGLSDTILNAMLDAAPAKPDAAVAKQPDCSPTLDKALGSIGTPENINAVRSTRMIGKIVISRSTGSTIFLIERIIMYPDRMFLSLRQPNGTGGTTVVTPEFNYLISGKMTTAVPTATLQDLTLTSKLELIYIAQHREQYGCALEGTEQIGNLNTAKLRIKSQGVEGELDVDPASGRLLRTTYVGPSGQVATDYTNWREVNNISVSFSRHVTNTGGTSDVTVSDYQINPTLDEAIFRAPANQPTAAITFKVLQAESVPYTVQTNGGINTACNISGSINTTGTASTFGNTTYGTATSTPNLQMNCRSSDTTIRWNHVLNAMLVQASDGNAYIIACDRAWRWSKCVPLKAGDTFLAKRGDKGFVVQSMNSKSKEQEATYSVLQSKSLSDRN